MRSWSFSGNLASSYYVGNSFSLHPSPSSPHFCKASPKVNFLGTSLCMQDIPYDGETLWHSF